jgi:hypothetical protein
MSYHCWSTAQSHPNYFSSFYFSPEDSLLFVGSIEKNLPGYEKELELERLSQPVIVGINGHLVRDPDEVEAKIPSADAALRLKPLPPYRMNVDKFRSLRIDDPSSLLWLPLSHSLACASQPSPYGLVAVSSGGGLLSIIDPFQLLHTQKYRETRSLFARQTNQSIYSLASPPHRPDSLLTLGIYEVRWRWRECFVFLSFFLSFFLSCFLPLLLHHYLLLLLLLLFSSSFTSSSSSSSSSSSTTTTPSWFVCVVSHAHINLWDLNDSLEHPSACVPKPYSPPSRATHCWVDDCFTYVCDSEVNFLDIRSALRPFSFFVC